MSERYARRLKSELGIHRRTRIGPSIRSMTQRTLNPERLEDRVLLAVGPQLISVQPNFGDILRDGAIRDIAPQELTFVFDEGQQIDGDTLDGIRLTRAGFDNSFEGVTDVMIQPGFVGVDPTRPNEVTMRFAETLPDDLYRLEVFAVDDAARGFVALRNIEGDAFRPRMFGANRERIGFELDLGAQIIAVVPQPTRRTEDGALTQARDQIEVYFNEDDLNPDSATDVTFYELIHTNDTVGNTDDTIHNPVSVQYDADLNLVTLTFENDLDQLSTGPGTYRLRVGTDEAIPDVPIIEDVNGDAGSSFNTATDLGRLDASRILSASIDPDGFPLDFPGASNEPGHRSIEEIQGHLNAEKDSEDGITTIEYNFQEIYGQDPQGNDLFNLITENQKQRTRQIFELYGYYMGVQFTETLIGGFTIVTGDIRVLDPTDTVSPGGTVGIAGPHPITGQPTAIMDSSELWDDAFGETLDPLRLSWMETAMHEIGHLLGLGHTDELPPFTLMNSDPELAFKNEPEFVFPGDHDIVHGRHLFRPESNDIDVYQYELDKPGVFSAEIIAERAAEVSHLDAVLTLYQEVDGRRTILARNDDYFSDDSLITMDLDEGTYFLAVTSTGNVDFDPTVEGSGFGGTTQGHYDLRLDFRPRVDNFLTDATGTAFDGDADGVPGGIYNYWMRVVGPESQVIVDKSAPDGGDGTLASPFNNLTEALNDPVNGVESGDIMRIVGNGGADGDLSTVEDNLAYELGISDGIILSDGADFVVPKGLTVMIDGGAIFKMLKTNIHVGSSSVTIDRSESALQILGTPDNNVIFTSYDDQDTGVDTNPRITTPDAGDWGGIIIQNDVDRAEGRFDYEQIGVYLNYVGQADIRYGGGNVTVDSIQQVVDPIHMIDARPTIGYNTITLSADAALSANPDSFEETNFSAPDSLGINYQEVPFTPDYNRVGPDIRGNRLVSNSINGMFVRIQTPAGDQLERMTVTGRWDDIDVVHVVPENLLINGRPGGPIDNGDGLEARTDAGLKIDPSTVVKLDGSRIEVTMSGQLLAEGLAGQEIILSSLQDTRYGAGGTFQTSSPANATVDPPQAGDWGGIFVAPTGRASIDYSVIAYGGGLTRVEGSFAGFNAVEVRQGELRLTRSLLENNAYGRGGQAERTRGGRSINGAGAIFVRGSQPIIASNAILNTEGFNAPVINVDVNSLNHRLVRDVGRSTGEIERIDGVERNRGPLIRLNRLADNSINGMIVRGATLTTQSVWDDTDIVHVVFDEIVIPDVHTYGGLRMQSSPTESLVVKLSGNDAGIVATGRPLDIEDRLGGQLHVVGQPGRPVVLTSLGDDSIGAGFTPSGSPQNDTDGGGRPIRSELPGSFQIDLNFGPLISGRPNIVAALEEAERIWEQLIEDPISITIDIELGDFGDGSAGSAQNELVSLDYDTVRLAMIADARAHEGIVAQIPTFAELNVTLPVDPGNPFSVSPQMTISSANAKALGIDPSLINNPPSQYDPTENRDAVIEFSVDPLILDNGGGEPSFFDYDRSDGIQPGHEDFVAVAIHEIGHALGFTSSVDAVDAGLGGGNRAINLNTLDLFRFEPGDGAADFTNAPRALDPELFHVFHDGGNFDPIDIPVPGLVVGDIPMSTGSDFGDGRQASHWWDNDLSPSPLPLIGLMDPNGTFPIEEKNLSPQDRTAMDLIGWDVVGGGIPGDWRGLTLEQNSSDRNVATLTELEPNTVSAPGTNALPATAEFLGELGRGEKNSDDNLRLGFELHGALHLRSDVDVYSFNAKAGTEVWLDIDRTSSSLDTVVELIDANGRVLARSDDSHAEQLGLEPLFAAPGIDAYILQKTLFTPEDFWTVNPKDAGFRVVLPGAAGGDGTYHVRVRSASDGLDVLSGGQTFGVYQLQVRLQDIDEHPGSTVQFADLRYAVDGVRIKGLPQHSPLTGEAGEAGGNREWNDEPAQPNPDNSKTTIFPTFLDAQAIGNVLSADRAKISVAGLLDSFNFDQADWYRFDVAFESLQTLGGNFADIVIDLDYSDGLSRANTSFAVYRAEPGNTETPPNPSGSELQPGELIYYSEDASIPDDLPAPLSGDDLEDLSRGTVGKLDPYLGPVSLQEGTYLLAIIPGTLAPCEIGQFSDRLPCNPYFRAEPIDTLQRVAEDHIGGDLGPLVSTPIDPPQVPVLLTGRSPTPYQLGDVQLFVSTSTSMFSVDPFTGERETTLGAYAGTFPDIGTIAPTIGDFALRDNPAFNRVSPDPEIARRQRFYAFNHDRGDGLATDATTGNYLWIDIDPLEGPPPPGTVVVRGVGEDGALTDDGIETYTNTEIEDPMQPSVERANGDQGVGVRFDAITFAAPTGALPDIEFGYAVGFRPDDPAVPQVFPELNLGYNPVENTGGVPNVLFRFQAADGQALSATGAERDDEERIPVPNPVVPPPPALPMEQPNAGTQLVESGVLEVTYTNDQGVDEWGGNITGISFVGGSLFGVTDRGHLYRILGQDGPGARARYIASIMDEDGELVSFQGLSLGPQQVEGGLYRTTLFGITRSGDIYAFDTDGVPQPIFLDGATFVSTGVGGAVGLEFATVDQNLWKITPDRGGDDGHTPGFSYYFGEDTNTGIGRHYDFLGGAHGSLVTNPFDLEGYARRDLPTLYFTYHLTTNEVFAPTATDTFRVFISDESRDDERGQWHLLASNNPGEWGTALDLNMDDDILLDVQPLFDNTWQDVPFPEHPTTPYLRNGDRDPFPYPDDPTQRPFDPGNIPWPVFDPPLNETETVWRQARIDLRDFAGRGDLRLRFDFSTAGSLNIGGAVGGVELHAISGARLKDGETFVIDEEVFEFDRGYSLTAVPGNRISEGETITVDGGQGALTYEFDRDGTVVGANIPIPITDQMSALEVADAMMTEFGANGPAPVVFHQNGIEINLEAATAANAGPSILLEGAPGATAGRPVPIHGGMDERDVAEAMVQPIADAFSDGNVDVIKQHSYVIQVIGHDVNDQGPLGLVPVLQGDALGSFNAVQRFLGNTQVEYPAGRDNTQPQPEFFDVIQEGVYLDDLIIGFASHGEQTADLRPSQPTPGGVPDAFLQDRGTFDPIPVPASIEFGEYQVELRRNSKFLVDGEPASLDARDRQNRTVTLIAPSGAEVFDGKTWRLSDGLRTVVFEYEDVDIGDGVAQGNIAIDFQINEPDYVIASRIRDLINSNAVNLDLVSATSGGEVVQPLIGVNTTDRVDIFGNAVVFPESPANGIEAIIFDQFGAANGVRDQGQVIIQSNSIQHSRQYGIVVEDGLRDLPEYTFYDPLDQIDHAQFATGDYIPHAGPVRNLREINANELAPGLTITNNVVAFNNEGGIHFSGDPNGFVFHAPVAPAPPAAEAGDGFIFDIVDHNGMTQRFVLRAGGAVRQVTNGDIFVDWTPTPAQPFPCVAIHGVDDCSNRYHPIERDMTDSLLHAIDSSSLDVTVMRGFGDELFIEGAAQIIGIDPLGWTFPFVQEVQHGNVPFGRIVNNTVVGYGGNLVSNNLFEDDDFRDVGILIEDNADPTVMNNVVVNFKRGIATDLSSGTAVVGGTLYQGNVDNAVNIDIGDFPLVIGPGEDLFVNRERGNFYPSAESRAIDSALDSLEDRPGLVTVKDPHNISQSPVLAPTFDVLGQLRIDDPRVEPTGGLGENVFKDRGAIDRVDFVGPRAGVVIPPDNDEGGLDTNPEPDKIRIDDSNLTEFVVNVVDLGEAGSATGTGVDDDLVTVDSVVLTRDGIPLIPGVDYRFDYQPASNEILLTPQAGVWLAGFTYEIELINEDRFVLVPDSADQIPDGFVYRVTDENQLTARFEFESGYTLEVPQPLTIQVPAGNSGLSAVSDEELFTISNGARLVTFEFDSDDDWSDGRIPVPFGPSSPPAEVADAIVAAIEFAQLGLAPQNLGGGFVHVGGPTNTLLDTSLTALVQQGQAGAVLDGQTFTIEDSAQLVTFEFDDDGIFTMGNVVMPFTSNDTRDEFAETVTQAIIGASFATLNPLNVGNGRVHLGGTADVLISTDNSGIQVLGQPGLQSMGFGQLVPIVYVPTSDVDQADVAELMRLATESSPLTGVFSFVNEAGELAMLGALTVDGIENRFIEGIQDFAGNKLQTNQDEAPFAVRFEIDLPAPLDFGDTPDPTYPTLLGENGARHVVVPNVFLGDDVDSELDAKTSSDATGDMFDDGVVFDGPIAPGGSVPIRMKASTSGFVDAWIDYDADGAFDPEADRVLNSFAVERGDNVALVTVPQRAVIGTTFARFRFSTSGGLSPVGRADNGEVEDYQIEVLDIDPPMAVADVYSVNEDETLTVSVDQGVLANDIDPEGGQLTATLASDVSNGELIFQADGSFSYTPDPDFFGSDTFTYVASTEILSSEPASVTIEVILVPDPPVAVPDDAVTNEDTPVLIDLAANDFDPDGALDNTSITVVTTPANGTVQVNPDGTALYTPAENYVGVDTFQYTIRDVGGAESNAATVTIDVEKVNDRPVAVDDEIFTPQGVPAEKDLIENDFDPDGEINPQSIVITLIPKSGIVDVNVDGTVTFTPTLSFLGTDTFRYTVRDDEGAVSNEAVVTINVTDENIPPVANDDEASTTEGQSVEIDVIANDEDVDGTIVPGSLNIVEDARNGSAVSNVDGTVTYTPDTGFVGEDTFRYVVRDQFNSVSNSATVTINVVPEGPPWQNPDNSLDVNADGVVIPFDALLVINAINNGGARPLDPPPIDDPPFEPPPYLDVNGDNFLSPFDALLVINELNSPSQPVAARAAVTPEVTPEVMADAMADEQVIGAALHIEPRLQSVQHQPDVVEEVFSQTSPLRAEPLEVEFDSMADEVRDRPDDDRLTDDRPRRDLLDDDLLDLLSSGL